MVERINALERNVSNNTAELAKLKIGKTYSEILSTPPRQPPADINHGPSVKPKNSPNPMGTGPNLKPVPDNSDSVSDGFQVPTYLKRRQNRFANRQKVVIGQQTSQSSFKGHSDERETNIFVFKVDKDTETKQVTDHMVKNGVTALNSEQTSQEWHYHKSFRIGIKRADFKKVMSPGFWPKGVGCRFFYPPNSKKQDLRRDSIASFTSSEMNRVADISPRSSRDSFYD